MFNGRVAVPKPLVRECGSAWQQWQHHLSRERKLLHRTEMWSAPAACAEDLGSSFSALGYRNTDKKIGSTDAVSKSTEIHFEGRNKSFLVVEVFFVGDRVNVLIGSDGRRQLDRPKGGAPRFRCAA